MATSSQMTEAQLEQLIADEFGVNADYVSELLRQFVTNPATVHEDWSAYFDELLHGNGAAAAGTGEVAIEPTRTPEDAG